MPGRKIAKRKGIVQRFVIYSGPCQGKKMLAARKQICSTESSASKTTVNVGTQTEISFAPSLQSMLPKQVNTAVMHKTCELSPKKLLDFCVSFTKKQQTRYKEYRAWQR